MPTPSYPPLYLQRVAVWWTKATRGMPQAAQRVQLPSAFALQPADLKALAAGAMQLITLHEQHNFAPQITYLPLTDGSMIQVSPLHILRHAHGATLRYRYRPSLGAPDRSHRPPVEMDIGTDKLAQLAVNGRFSGYSIGWLYQLTVINMAVGLPLERDLFLRPPDHHIEELEHLF